MHPARLQAIMDAARSLQQLHRAGYAHRDVKPANLLWLPRERRWVLSDYTAAAPLGDSAPLASALGYSPPEAVQASVAARSHTAASAAADAWSLGVVAFELLTGRPALQVAMLGREEVCCWGYG